MALNMLNHHQLPADQRLRKMSVYDCKRMRMSACVRNVTSIVRMKFARDRFYVSTCRLTCIFLILPPTTAVKKRGLAQWTELCRREN